MLIEQFLQNFRGVKGGSGQFSAYCPAHDDRHRSLSISTGDDGRILVCCHAGCTPEQIVATVGLKMGDLFIDQQKTPKSESQQSVIATYDYFDADGHLVAQKLRKADKYFVWRKPDGIGGWVYNRKDVVIPLYNLPIILKSDSLFIVEGEKDVDTLTKAGKPATSGADGAGPGKWRQHYIQALKGKHVAIIQDNDAIGKEFALETARAVYGTAASVRVLDLTQIWPDLPEHGDTTELTDHMELEAGVAAIVDLANSSPKWKPPPEMDTVEAEGCPHLNVISAPDLQKANLPEVKFLVADMLPEGTGMISAPSKIGKSWFVLDMGLSIAAGEPFMEHKTLKCGVLYLALEDSMSRLQNRMGKVWGEKPAPPMFFFSTDAPTLDNGLLDILEDHLMRHSETKLIIIDTFQKIRGQALPREGPYAQDYREMSVIKKFMDSKGISVFFVHHNRKMKDDDDPFNMISGTNGIMGAADTIMIMTKDKRADETATIHITGRDVQQSSTVVKFNKENWKWTTVGEVDWLAEQRERLEYQNNPIVKTIKKLMDQSTERRWDGTAQELLDAGKYITGTFLACTPRDLTNKLKLMDKPLFDYDGIIHDRVKNGSGGGKHKFYHMNVEGELCDQEDLPF